MLFIISFVILFCVPLVRVCVDTDCLERSDGLSLNYGELMDTDDSDNYYSYLGYMYVSEIFSDIRDGVQVFFIMGFIKICINPRKPRRYFNGQYR